MNEDDDLLKKILGIGKTTVSNLAKSFKQNIGIESIVPFIPPKFAREKASQALDRTAPTGITYRQGLTDLAKTAPENFGNFLREGIDKYTPNFVRPIIRPISNMVANTGRTVASGVTDIASSAAKLATKPVISVGDIVKNTAKGVYGASKVVAAGAPVYQTANALTQLPSQSSVIPRLASGFMSGMSGIDNIGNVPDKPINIKLGDGEISFDPIKGIGQMVGFIKNPINSKIFGATEKIAIPLTGKTANFFATNAVRGGIENFLMDLQNLPDDATPDEKAKFLMKTTALGAVMEIGGRGITEYIPDLLKAKVPALSTIVDELKASIRGRQAQPELAILPNGQPRTPGGQYDFVEKNPLFPDDIPNLPSRPKVPVGDITPENAKTGDTIRFDQRYGERFPVAGGRASVGAFAGVEVYQDENGDYKVRFSPEKAALGIGAAAFLSTKGHLTDIENLIKQAKTPNDAIPSVKESLEKKLGNILNRVPKEGEEALKDLKGLRAAVNKTMYGLADVDPKAGKSQAFYFEQMKQNPEISGVINTLEDYIGRIDEVLKNGAKTIDETMAGVPNRGTGKPLTMDEIFGKQEVGSIKDNGESLIMKRSYGDTTKEYKLKDFADNDGYIYHTTSPNNLDLITKDGLKVNRGHSGNGVYFAPDEASTVGQASYDGAIVRVNINKLDPKKVVDADVNGFGDPTELLYGEAIPTSAIEVKTKNGWQPIIPSKQEVKPETTEIKVEDYIKPKQTISQDINKVEGDSLLIEAKKYKSAEDINLQKIFNHLDKKDLTLYGKDIAKINGSNIPITDKVAVLGQAHENQGIRALSTWVVDAINGRKSILSPSQMIRVLDNPDLIPTGIGLDNAKKTIKNYPDELNLLKQVISEVSPAKSQPIDVWNNANKSGMDTNVPTKVEKPIDNLFKQPALPEGQKPIDKLFLKPGDTQVKNRKEAVKALKTKVEGQGVVVNNPLKPSNKVITPVADKPFVVSTANQARKILAKYPGAKVEVDKKLTSGGKVIIPPPAEGTLPFTYISDIEKTLYGSATPSKMDITDGNKEGAGVVSDKLRGAQESISQFVGNLTENENAVIRNFGRVLQGFAGGLGKTTEDVARKGEFRGGIEYAAKIAADGQQYVYKLLNNSEESLEKIHAVMDPELNKSGVKVEDLTKEEVEAYEFLKMTSDFINDTNHKNGFISDEKWLENKGGKYIARAYEPIDYPPEIADFMTQTRNKFDLNPFKKRAEIDDWKEANAIKDPAYLMSKRLQQTMFNDTVKKMSDEMINTKYVSEVEKPGFVQVSDSKLYGNLAGKYVRKDALEDMRGFFFTHDAAQKFYDLVSWYDKNPIRRGYKKIFTIFNPAVRLGNKTGNYVFATLSGINPVTFAKNQSWAKGALKDEDVIVRRMIQDGLLGTDITKADIVNSAESLKRGVKDPNILKKIDEVLTSRYSQTDDIAKIAAMKTWLDRGFNYKEASRRVYNGFQNYRNVGWLYDLGAKVPVFGNPFVRFKADLGRILKNAAIDHPFRLATTVMGIKLFTDMASRLSGESEEDRKTRETRVGAPRIPFTNISLAVQTPWGEINAARLLGAYAYNPVGGASLRGDASEYLPFEMPEKRNAGSDPLIGPLISVALDTDFRGKSIKDPNASKYTGSLLTKEEQRANQLKYLARSYTPTTVNSLVDVVAAAQGKEDFYGRKRSVAQAAIRAYPGIKVEQFGEEEAQAARDKDIYYASRKVDSLQKDISAIRNQLKRGDITEEQANKRIESIQQQIKETAPVGGAKTEKGTSPSRVKSLGELYGFSEYLGENSREGLQKYEYEKDKTSEARKIFLGSGDYENITDDEKQSIIEDGFGYDYSKVRYDAYANADTTTKVGVIKDEIKDHAELIKTLKIGRTKSMSGKQFASDGVLDELYKQGLISNAEKKALKNLDPNDDGTFKKTGSGSSKSKSISDLIKALKDTPKLQSVESLIKNTKKGVAYKQREKSGISTDLANLSTPKSIKEGSSLENIDNLIKKSKISGVSPEANKLFRGAGGFSGGSTPKKLSKSFYKPA